MDARTSDGGRYLFTPWEVSFCRKSRLCNLSYKTTEEVLLGFRTELDPQRGLGHTLD